MFETIPAPSTEKNGSEVPERVLAQKIVNGSLHESELDPESSLKEARISLAQMRSKSPEIREELDAAKTRILRFAESIGAKAEMPADEDIYIRDDLYARYDRTGERKTGVVYPAEVAVLENPLVGEEGKRLFPQTRQVVEAANAEARVHDEQYCLLESACPEKEYVRADGQKARGRGLAAQGRYETLNDALLEATNFQIFAESGISPKHLENPEGVMFLSALVEDMTWRLNGGDLLTPNYSDVCELPFFGERIEARHRLEHNELIEVLEKKMEHPDYGKYFFTRRDVFAEMQRGMLVSDDKCLEAIGRIYGAQAQQALSEMGDSATAMDETGGIFNRTSRTSYNSNNLQNRFVSSLDSYRDNIGAHLTIGNIPVILKAHNR